MALVWRRVVGRRRWFGDGEGWRREVEGGVLDEEEEWDMVMWGVLWGAWAERAEEEGRAWRVVVADMVGVRVVKM